MIVHNYIIHSTDLYLISDEFEDEYRGLYDFLSKRNTLIHLWYDNTRHLYTESLWHFNPINLYGDVAQRYKNDPIFRTAKSVCGKDFKELFPEEFI